MCGQKSLILGFILGSSIACKYKQLDLSAVGGEGGGHFDLHLFDSFLFTNECHLRLLSNPKILAFVCES